MFNNFLTIDKATIRDINLHESMAYENDVLLNRIWYAGDANLIEQYFKKLAGINNNAVSKDRFWAAIPMQGMGIRKIHSGLPQEIVNVLSDIIISDMDKVKIENETYNEAWEAISGDEEDGIDIREIVQDAITETLVTGDGAFKISIDTSISNIPQVEFYSGEEVKYEYHGNKVKKIKFYTRYNKGKKSYILEETYYRGGIDYKLYNEKEKEVPLEEVEELKDLRPVEFSDKSLFLAVPCMFYKSSKYKGRGKSIYDNKTELFDAFDEAISAWTDAERDNRAKNYIPEDMFPHDPETGETLQPNPFQFRFIRISGGVELGKDTIATNQGSIDFQAHQANIISKRDQCIEGIISGATLGFNVSADASGESQKEKKDTTIITRNHITARLEKVIRKLVIAIIKAKYQVEGRIITDDIVVDFTFGEYSRLSFDDKIRTLASARPGEAIISKETIINELWGDSKSEEWKAEELARLETEQSIIDIQPFHRDDEDLFGGFSDEDKEAINSDNNKEEPTVEE